MGNEADKLSLNSPPRAEPIIRLRFRYRSSYGGLMVGKLSRL